MTTLNEMYHNGKNWILTICPEESNGNDTIEVNITDKEKEELEKIGVETYKP
jgi:hypothetical protein